MKLSAILTAVLMLTSIGFSVAVYNLAVGEVERPAPTEINRRPDFEIIFRNRNREIRANLLIKHVVANLIVLVFGAVGSYFLARWVLKPVAANMEAQARFVSDASHELRTPLTVMAMENETLLHSGATRRADLLKQIESNLEEVGKLRALTDNLLKLSLDEKLEISNLDLAEVADAACREISKSAAARKIVVKNQVKSSEISANRAALVEILVILLDNAIKYSPAGSVVVLSYHSGEISVRDSGVGISDSDLPHIFDRFYRGDQSRSSPGFGLGLPLAQRLAKQMGFVITAKPNRTAGMTFTITF